MPGVLLIPSVSSAMILSVTIGKLADAAASAERSGLSTEVKGFRIEGVDVITRVLKFSRWNLFGTRASIASLRMLPQ